MATSSACKRDEDVVGAVRPDGCGDRNNTAVIRRTSYVVGRMAYQQLQTMEKEPFNEKQRDVFARMLMQAKERAHEELESDDDVERRADREVVAKLAKEQGALELVANVRKLRKEVEDVEEKLEHLGFECNAERIVLRYDAPKALRKTLETAKRSARLENQKSLKKFDLAILGVWAAATADDARKIVEGLL